MKSVFKIAAISVLALVGAVITHEIFSPYTAWYFIVPKAQFTVNGKREQGWLHRGNHRETLFLTRRDKGKAESYMICFPTTDKELFGAAGAGRLQDFQHFQSAT